MTRGILVLVLTMGCAPAGPYCEPSFLGDDSSSPACPEGMGRAVCALPGSGDCADIDEDVRCHGRDAEPYCGTAGYELRCLPFAACR